MPAYIPTTAMYAPVPAPAYARQEAYDPVLERGAAVSPMADTPTSPAPLYKPPEVNVHEMSQGPGRGRYEAVEVHGLGSQGNRVELG